MLRSLSTLTLAALLLVGCNSPTLATRLSAKTLTMVTLAETDATASEADAIVTIAVMVKTSAGGEFDPALLHDEVLEAIASAFSGQQRLVYVSIADELLLIIEEEIANADDPLELGEAGIFINAAALGVEQGAQLYILLLEAE